MSDYPDHLTMREARAIYFAANHFGADGGYDDKFAVIQIGPAKIPFPNSKGRAKAVRYHDLHHIVTGYGTDFPSETAISAWEVGAGCGTSIAAWMINLSAMSAGLATAPKTTFAAFVRGRRSQSLYGQPFEPLLAKDVRTMRAEAHIPAPGEPLHPTIGDRAMLAVAIAGAAIATPLVFAATLALLPFGIAAIATRATTTR